MVSHALIAALKSGCARFIEVGASTDPIMPAERSPQGEGDLLRDAFWIKEQGFG